MEGENQKELNALVQLTQAISKIDGSVFDGEDPCISKAVFSQVSRAMRAFCPEISVISLRLDKGVYIPLQGTEEVSAVHPRMTIEHFWPEQLAKLINTREDIRAIKVEESAHSWRKVLKKKNYYRWNVTTTRARPALRRFLDAIEKEGLKICVHSLLAIPMLYENRRLGVCSIYSGVPTRRKDFQERGLTACVRVLGVAYARQEAKKEKQINTVLWEALKIYTTRWQQLVSQQDLSRLDGAQSLEGDWQQQLTWIIVKELKVDSASFILYKPQELNEDRRLEVRCTWELNAQGEPELLRPRETFYLPWKSITGAAFQNRRSLVYSDADEQWQHLNKDAPYKERTWKSRTCAVFLVEHNGMLRCAIGLESSRQDAFTDTDFRTLKEIIPKFVASMLAADSAYQATRERHQAVAQAVQAAYHYFGNTINFIPEYATRTLELLHLQITDKASKNSPGYCLGRIITLAEGVGKKVRWIQRVFRELVILERVEVIGLLREQCRSAEESSRVAVALTCETAQRVYVESDREHLEWILQNLIMNATSACRECTKGQDAKVIVALNLSSDGQIVEIEVADTADGLPADVLECVFEKPKMTSRSGSGMGLYLSRVTVGRIGATLELIGTKTNGSRPSGTAFKLTLPAAIRCE